MADAKKEVTDCIKIEKYIKIEPGGVYIGGNVTINVHPQHKTGEEPDFPLFEIIV